MRCEVTWTLLQILAILTLLISVLGRKTQVLPGTERKIFVEQVRK